MGTLIGEANAPDWLVRRPIAHRGLHDRAAGVVENSMAAARAAAERGFAVECDLQLTADGEAVVFHDFDLDRLTGESGPVRECDAAALSGIALAGAGGEAVPGFAAFLGVVAGRVPVVCEIKSRFDGDARLADRAAAVAESYGGPLAFKSFDPRVVAHLRARGVPRPLGLVAEAAYEGGEWEELPQDLRAEMAALAHVGDTRPDFLSYGVRDLPHAAPALFRGALGRPVMAWTVRNADQRRSAARWADQMVFEGFLP